MIREYQLDFPVGKKLGAELAATRNRLERAAVERKTRKHP